MESSDPYIVSLMTFPQKRKTPLTSAMKDLLLDNQPEQEPMNDSDDSDDDDSWSDMDT